MKSMKKILLMVAFLAITIGSFAQQHERYQGEKKFSPEQFEAELHRFITERACLTPQEAAAFFPIYKEMQNKQRVIFNRMREQGRIKPADNKGCEKYIKNRDDLEVEQKRIQQTYHNKLLSVVSASKLFDAIIAEDIFFRQKMRNFGRGQGMQPQQRKKNKE